MTSVTSVSPVTPSNYNLLLKSVAGGHEDVTEVAVCEAFADYQKKDGRYVLCPENYGRLCIREINGVLTVCFHKGSVSGYRRDASTVPLSGANAIEAQRILKELIKI